VALAFFFTNGPTDDDALDTNRPAAFVAF